MAINNESQKDVKDEAVMQRLNFELREVYAKIMANPNMVLYNEAKQDMDQPDQFNFEPVCRRRGSRHGGLY